MTVPALELIDVRAGYGRIDVLHGVDLTIPKGKVLALLGANGAGKSTTAQIAGGRLVPRSGCFHVGGNHVNGAHPAALAKAGVVTVPEGRGIFPNLTVDENLWVTTHLIVRELYENVALLKEQGIAILVVEQFAETALGIADYAAIMAHGRITAIGYPDEIAGALSNAYLGGAA